MKRRVLTLVLALVLICALSATMLVGCAKDKNKDNQADNQNNNKPVVPAAKATSYVALDINPSVELILDQNNVVMSVRGLNSDANVVLQGENGIVGAKADVAVKEIGKLSTELGYINEDNKVINVNVSTALENKDGEKLTADIKANVKKGAEDAKPSLEVSIKTDGEFSLQREFKEFNAAHPEVTDIAHYRLIMEAVEAEMKAVGADLKNKEEYVTKAINMKKDELIEIISDAREDAVEEALNLLPEAEKKALEASEDALDYIIERLETTAYLKVALEDSKVGTLLDLSKMNDHVKYIIYKNLEITLDDINDIIERSKDAIVMTLSSEDMGKVLDVLVQNGVITAEEKTEAMTKEYTLDEVEDYLDIKLKNTASETADAIDDALDTILDGIEDEFDRLEEEYKLPAEVETEIKTKINNIGKDILDRINERVDLTKLEGLKKKFEDDINAIIDINVTNMTTEYFENLEDEYEEKAELHEENIKAEMSKTEGLLDKVDEYKEYLKTDSKVVKAQADFEAQLKVAVENATKALEAEKAARIEANKDANVA